MIIPELLLSSVKPAITIAHWLGLPFLIAMWFGILALRRNVRPMCWWIMLAGTAAATFGWGMMSPSVMKSAMIHLPIPNPLVISFYLNSNIRLIYPSGLLLFALGFATHAKGISRARSRITELEMMNLAQATELERLRNR